MANKKRKKGYILAYSVTVMMFAVMLISVAMGLLKSTVSLSNVSKNAFLSDYTFSQIEEYLLCEDFFAAEAMTFGTKYQFVMVYDTDETGAGIIEIFVSESGRTRLYYKKRNDKIVAYVYGDKPIESNGE